MKEDCLSIKKAVVRARCMEVERLEKTQQAQKTPDQIFWKAFRQGLSFLGKKDVGSIASTIMRSLQEDLEEDLFVLHWQREAYIQEREAITRRFLNWIADAEVLNTNLYLKAISDAKTYFITGDILCRFKGEENPTVLLISEKNSFFLSDKAKNPFRIPGNDPFSLVAKIAVETAQMNDHINVAHVFLRNGYDEQYQIQESFLTRGCGAQGNLLHANFYKCMEGDRFCMEKAYIALGEVLASADRIWPKPCSCCRFFNLCKLPAHGKEYNESTLAVLEKRQFVQPKYTAKQMEAIRTTQGPVRLVCGPGSGKTATLVGRCFSMIASGINPANILMVCFSNKAAKELSEKVQSFCKSDKMPTIATINALGLKILEESWHELGYSVKTLSDVQRKKIALSILEENGIIAGMPSVVYGEYGLIEKFLEKFEIWKEDPEGFQEKREFQKVDIPNFLKAATQFAQRLKAGGYITFDDQVNLAIKLLEGKPALLKQYQSTWHYIMCDEYQDVNISNARLLDLLASGKGNLCVAGDDDQTIYAFRGAENGYLVDFEERYPTVKSFYLKYNFRTTQRIMELANTIVHPIAKRIPKEIEAIRPGTCLPKFCTGAGEKELIDIIERVKQKGWDYKDIAILTQRNSDVENLFSVLPFPKIIQKGYVRKDYLFNVLRDVLNLYQSDPMDSDTLLHLIYLFQRIELRQVDYHNLYSSLCTVYDLPDVREFSFYDNSKRTDLIAGVFGFLSAAFRYLDIGGGMVYQVMCKIASLIGFGQHILLEKIQTDIEKGILKDRLDVMTEYFNDTVFFQSEERLNLVESNSITLSTYHDAKGLEWPVVILWGTESFARKREEQSIDDKRRLLYTAITRAKEELYLLSRKDGNSELELEIANHLKKKGEG